MVMFRFDSINCENATKYIYFINILVSIVHNNLYILDPHFAMAWRFLLPLHYNTCFFSIASLAHVSEVRREARDTKTGSLGIQTDFGCGRTGCCFSSEVPDCVNSAGLYDI